MLFNSITYLLFLPAAVVAFWCLPSKMRGIFLLAASFYFYMSWLPIYGLLLTALTVGNYVLGLAIARADKLKQPLLIIGLAANLLTLGYFKYTDFLIESWNKWAAALAPLLSLNAQSLNLPLQHVLLPLGISFFVFEFIHYLSDVFKGSKPVKNFVEFSLFAAFFPSQIAGPIKRYQAFIKQLETPAQFSIGEIERGTRLILQGLFKKVAIADNLSPIVAQGFAQATSLGAGEAWLAALAFAAQIYCDFSGYTDMGRGSAIMMGFDLPDNFNWPYLASNLSDFWKRWHISLSTWLRDYLYIPLGGSKCSLGRRHVNLVITMVLGGLWHGASWHFVVWGAFHGLGLVFTHSYAAFVSSENRAARILATFHDTTGGRLFSILLTFVFVLVGWVFFRADNTTQACQLLQSMFTGFSTQGSSCLGESLQKYPALIALSAYALYHLACLPKRALPQFPYFAAPARCLAYISAFVLATGLAPAGDSPFIYFQF